MTTQLKPKTRVPVNFGSLEEWFNSIVDNNAKNLTVNTYVDKHPALQKKQAIALFNQHESEIFVIIRDFHLRIYGSANVLMAIASYDCKPQVDFDDMKYKAVLLSVRILAYQYLAVHHPEYPQPQVFHKMESNRY